MFDIKPIPEQDQLRFIDIVANTYVGFRLTTDEGKESVRQRTFGPDTDPRASLWGCYEQGEMVGGIMLWDFRMNLFGRMTDIGGGGFLAVDIWHKKKGAALAQCEFFFRRYRERGNPLVVLWPFRPDFYVKMGAGMGARMNIHRLTPQQLPDCSGRAHIKALSPKDCPALADTFNREVPVRTGMIEENADAFRRHLKNYGHWRYAAYDDGTSHGFIGFFHQLLTAESRNWAHRMVVPVFLKNSPASLAGILAFLRSQADQTDMIEIHTIDDHFSFCLDDPRSDMREWFPPVYHPTSIGTTGIMYRVVDTKAMIEALAHRNFNGASMILRLSVADSLLKENNGPLTVRFDNGFPRVDAGARPDAELALNNSAFSSLIMGAVPLEKLIMYGKAVVTPLEQAVSVDRLFRVDQKPICTKWF